MKSKTLSQEGLEEFARRIKHHMREIGIKSNAELAKRASKVARYEITRQMVHKWKNAIAYAGEQNRQALADVFGVPVSEITVYEDSGSPARTAPLSNGRVPFRYSPDPYNPALVRAEMSDVLTIEQAEKIATMLAPLRK